MSTERMPAGRELDALVAEKVMGRRWFTFIRDSYLLDPGAAASICFRGSSWTEGKHAQWDSECGILTDLKFQRVPDYSTDIAAAWEVVLKMCADGTPPTLNAVFGGWHCSFRGHYATIKNDPRSAPLAICSAALMAVGA